MIERSPEHEQPRYRKRAEETAVTKLCRQGRADVSVTYFEWYADKIYWLHITKPHYPPWPWEAPEEDPDEERSETFARILSERRVERDEEDEEEEEPQPPHDRKRKRSNSPDEPQDSQRRRLETPTEEQNEFLRLLNQISAAGARLFCAKGGGLDMPMLLYLIPRLAHAPSRQHLYHFLEEAPEEIWFSAARLILGPAFVLTTRSLGVVSRVVVEEGIRKLHFRLAWTICFSWESLATDVEGTATST
ncbi:hypothetical protein ACHAPT_003860 [Fusarium lateritium]